MKRTLAVAAVILAVLIGGQGQALAANFEKPFEDEMATQTFAPGSPSACSEQWNFIPEAGYIMTAKGCFTKYGDVWHILDAAVDGQQTFIYWENWLWNGSSWKPYRSGWCNNDLGGNNWGKCNKDYYESSSTNYYGGKGSRLRFQVCRRNFVGTNCTPGSIDGAAWINNDA